MTLEARGQGRGLEARVRTQPPSEARQLVGRAVVVALDHLAIGAHLVGHVAGSVATLGQRHEVNDHAPHARLLVLVAVVVIDPLGAALDHGAQ